MAQQTTVNIFSPEYISDADLEALSSRSFRQSARDWAEYRAEPHASPIKNMLYDAAMSSARHHEMIRAEQQRRDRSGGQ